MYLRLRLQKEKVEKARYSLSLSLSLNIYIISRCDYYFNTKKKCGSIPGVNSTSRASRVVQRDTELLSVSLRSILAATDDFSEENKLGEGGFGPVYKVIN